MQLVTAAEGRPAIFVAAVVMMAVTYSHSVQGLFYGVVEDGVEREARASFVLLVGEDVEFEQLAQLA